MTGKGLFFSILFSIIASFLLVNFANAQTVVFSNTPAADDVAFTQNLDPAISSSTRFSNDSLLYFARFLSPINADFGQFSRVYAFACGLSGQWAIVDETVDQTTATGTINGIKNCTPNFFEENRNNFLNWSYFDIPRQNLSVGEFIFWRTDSVDFRDTDGNDFFYISGSETYTGGGNWPNDAERLIRTTENPASRAAVYGSSWVVLVDQFNSNLTIEDDSLIQNFNTRFIDAEVTGTSTNAEFIVEYLHDVSEFTPNNRPDILNTVIFSDGFFDDKVVYSSQKFILPITNGISTTSVPIDLNLIDGNYIAQFSFWNLATNLPTFTQTGLTVFFTVSAGNVSITEIQTFDGQNLDTAGGFESCGISNLTGCFNNFYRSFIGLFTPSDTVFSQFVSIWQAVENKPPFGYLTSLFNIFESIDENSTSAFSFGQIPFAAAIFDPLKILLASVLWFFYLVWLYRRLIKFTI